MNKAELVAALAVHFGGSRDDARYALDAVMETITFALATDGRVLISGFGTFEKTTRPPRQVTDPRTGRKRRVNAPAVPTFRPGAELKAYAAGTKKPPKRALQNKPAVSPSKAEKPPRRPAGPPATTDDD